LKQRSY
ncbi:mce related family protein, partial [Vibrio parahaemolyticus V-223/04]